MAAVPHCGVGVTAAAGGGGMGVPCPWPCRSCPWGWQGTLACAGQVSLLLPLLGWFKYFISEVIKAGTVLGESSRRSA